MLLTHPRIHVWDRPNWTVAERLDEFRERLPCERQHRRASMRGLVLSLLCSTVHGGSTLSLSGSESSIVFGKDVSSAATLTASCGHKQPTFTLIKPNVLQGHTPGQTVVVLLGSVAPTCLVVADWRTTPCGVLPSDDLAVPPLFYCIYSGGAGSVSVGPIVANTTSVSHDGYYLGHSVRAHCPIPALGDLMRLGPYNGTQPSYKVELTLSYFSAEGDSAIPFEFAGAVGGNVVDFQNLPAPPPPSPPSFPPWSAAYQYEQRAPRHAQTQTRRCCTVDLSPAPTSTRMAAPRRMSACTQTPKQARARAAPIPLCMAQSTSATQMITAMQLARCVSSHVRRMCTCSGDEGRAARMDTTLCTRAMRRHLAMPSQAARH